MDTLPTRLRWLRKQKGMTLAELGGWCGASVSFLSDLERGRTMPSLEMLEAIAEVYGLTVGEALVNVRIRPEEDDAIDGRLTAEEAARAQEEWEWIKRKERELSL